LKAEYIINRLN